MAHDSIDRRRFLEALGGAGFGLGYSLHVRADDPDALPLLLEEEPEADAIRDAIETLTPDDTVDARVRHEKNLRLVDVTCDFFVAGGGMAGVCAALSAARNGASVVLVQDRSRLGGNASSEVRMHIVGADHHGGRPGWREGGIIEELRLENAVHNPDYHWEMWDLMLYDKVISEPNIRLLLDTAVCAAEVSNGRIKRVLARSDKTEHLYRITAKHYADCTGDCRLGLEAGARMRMGHEARSEFNEPLAPETSGPGSLGSSILFTAKDMGAPRPYTAPKWARKITSRHLQYRKISSWEYGYWWIEWGGHLSAIHDNERIRFELLAIVLGVWDYVKNSGEFPDAENWAMDWIGMIPGKRASRRLDGPHILTQQDCMGLNGEFADAVAIGGWPFDNHPPEGFDGSDAPPYTSVKIDDVYSVPLRSLHSVNIENLFMAGRNISASHVAFTSTRVMATCSVFGQAIGAAAAFCAKNNLLPGELTANDEMLQRFRQQLLRDDQTIKGLANADPADRARAATVNASASVEGSAPENVINGLVRDLPRQWKNRWGAKMADGTPWLELRWDTPQTLREIQLTFDTGFQRQLTLSEQANQKKGMIRGPQPETIADYALEYLDDSGAYHELVSVTDNYQRLRRHAFNEITAKAVRFHALRTQGAEEARLYEIRCY